MHAADVTASAPRYHPAVHAAVERLDDGQRPVADVWRDVASLADELGVTRPSYTHVLRHVHAIREVRSARRTIAAMLGAERAGELVSQRYERRGRRLSGESARRP